ncbi:cupredoxin domain-containing protein [Stutzerimonas nitrititolerans]|uniref:cupredoxin domain-containing protein n=1 Tax=Stutzerimonas nitrititolerans TaxID=2482751 RepID=UPI0028A59D53|nr:plastocyanin/azurin family copper-binding protein [Stutzerimonas nitrititolerans]
MKIYSLSLFSALGLVFSATAAMAAPGHSHALDFGQPGDAQAVDRTIEVRMSDNVFALETIEVKAGETVRFVLHNDGALLHEFNLGYSATHAAHEQEMIAMFRSGMLTPTGAHDMSHMEGEMDGGMAHDDPNSVLIEPGAREELIWTFSKTKNLEFACNIPGHYQAGMVGKVEIR